MIYGLYELGGVAIVTTFFVVLWIVISVIWIRLAGLHRASAWFGPFFLLTFALCLQMRFDQRPEVFSYFFLVVQLVILTRVNLDERPSFQTLAGLFVIEAVFANCHGYFALGPMIGGALFVSVVLSPERKNIARYRSAGLIFLALGFGSLVSPFGINAWRLVFAYREVGIAMRDTNVEMFPTSRIYLNPPMILFWINWVLITLYASWSVVRKRYIFESIIALAGAWLGFKMFRNIPLFLIFAAPLTRHLVAALESGVLPKLRAIPNLVPNSAYALTAFVLSVFVVSGGYHRSMMSLTTFGFGVEPASYPIGATRFLQSIDFKGRVFCDSYDGGYLEFMMPHLKIAGDSYFLDSEVTLRFFDAIKKPQILLEEHAKHRFDALLINIENSDVLDVIRKSPEWVLADSDSHRTVYLRSNEFARFQRKPADGNHFVDRDLRHWMYAFSPVTWIQIALKTGDVGLAEKLVSEYSGADHLPSTFVRGAMIAGMIHQNRDLFERALKLRNQSYESEPGDFSAIDKMASGVR